MTEKPRHEIPYCRYTYSPDDVRTVADLEGLEACHIHVKEGFNCFPGNCDLGLLGCHPLARTMNEASNKWVACPACLSISEIRQNKLAEGEKCENDGIILMPLCEPRGMAECR